MGISLNLTSILPAAPSRIYLLNLSSLGSTMVGECSYASWEKGLPLRGCCKLKDVFSLENLSFPSKSLTEDRNEDESQNKLLPSPSLSVRFNT